MDILAGKMLMNNQGKFVPFETVLQKKNIIVFYFSASWCTPCQVLLPKLRRVFQENLKRRIGMEIIYVSFDDDKTIMIKYFREKHGNWYMIPFGDITNEELRLLYDISHIPQIVAIRPDGTIITKTGKQEIERIGINVLVTWSE